MGTLDRDAAREVLEFVYQPEEIEALLDALEKCVRPALAQTIDSDALIKELCDQDESAHESVIRERAGNILALLRPVDGVILTCDEAEYAKRWLPIKNSQRARDLATRLKAVS